MRPILVFFVLFAANLAFAACGNVGNDARPLPSPTSAAPLTEPTIASLTITRPPQNTTTPAQLPTQTPTLPPIVTPAATKIPATASPAPTQPPPTNTRAASAGSFSVSADEYITGLKKPVFVTHAGDGSGRLFIVEQAGRILVAENGRVRETPFLNIRNKVNTNGSERGLLSVAFHPDYKTNGTFFVYYTGLPDGGTVVERYHVSNDPNVADENSAQMVLQFDQPEPNHNGGMLAFGPDGYLYVGLGDGGGAGDRHGAVGNGQNLDTLLGKILRLDVTGDTYRVPANNPFVGQANVKPEIWAYGLRNPWRFSFDRATGDLYIADVGQSNKEEIDFQPASSGGGENYGWRIMEGDECYDAAQDCKRGDLIAPIAVYSHDLGCSVTGGYVYRGQLYPWLVGKYIFADYCTGIVWTTARDANGKWDTNQAGKFDDTISSFGQDEAGELYVVGHGNGVIYKLSSSR